MPANREKFDVTTIVMPKGMKEKVAEMAALEHRSVSKQFVHIFTEYFEKYEAEQKRSLEDNNEATLDHGKAQQCNGKGDGR